MRLLQPLWWYLRNQRALKAQQSTAWGNAPGTQPLSYCRVVDAKVAVGVTTASLPMTEAVFVGTMAPVEIIPIDLTLRYFCACSAHWNWGCHTWGVAPGCKLLRLQRAL